MATTAKIVYNFNENNATTIRDFSENGNDATSSTISVQSSSRVGNEALFDDDSDVLSLGNITYLNNSEDAALHFGVKFTTSTGTGLFFSKSGLIKSTYNYSTNSLSFQVTDSSATNATVSATLVIDTYYDITLIYSADVLTLYVDGVSIDTDNTLVDGLASNSNNMYIGYNNGDAELCSRFVLNEFKLYNEAITTNNIDAWIAEQNGILSSSVIKDPFQVGDVIATQENETPKFAVVSFADFPNFRFLPLTSGITGSMFFSRVAHLWDTTRQWSLKIDDTPSVCFYDNQTKSSEVFTESKKTYCLTKEGAILPSTTKTSNYTLTGSDARIYVDSSAGAFTLTLPSSPTTNKEFEIVDSVGYCRAFNVIIDGNGNNIIGYSQYIISIDYEGIKLIFNGTNWNLI